LRATYLSTILEAERGRIFGGEDKDSCSATVKRKALAMEVLTAIEMDL